MKSKKFIVAQIGAREHYGVAVALHRQQRLNTLYTDFWASAAEAAWLRRIPVAMCRRMAGRSNPEIPDAMVRSRNFRTLASEFRERIMRDKMAGIDDYFFRQGVAFSNWVQQSLEKAEPDFDATVYYGFTGTALESLRFFHEHRGLGILNQISIWRDWDILEEERKRWPEWENCSFVPSRESQDRVLEECRIASMVVVNSNISKQALIDAGIPAVKIEIVPLAYLAPPTGVEREMECPRRLRVLFLGQVRLQKGIQYLIQAARMLGNDVEIKAVGEVVINPDKLADVPDNMTFTGSCPRHLTAEMYRWADVFVFPTLADGFGITQLEAASYGLPLIVTPCCGEVVRDGVEGLIIPPRCPEALAEAIGKLRRDPELRMEMGKNARTRSGEFTLGNVAARIIAGIDQRGELQSV